MQRSTYAFFLSAIIYQTLSGMAHTTSQHEPCMVEESFIIIRRIYAIHPENILPDYVWILFGLIGGLWSGIKAAQPQRLRRLVRHSQYGNYTIPDSIQHHPCIEIAYNTSRTPATESYKLKFSSSSILHFIFCLIVNYPRNLSLSFCMYIHVFGWLCRFICILHTQRICRRCRYTYIVFQLEHNIIRHLLFSFLGYYVLG